MLDENFLLAQVTFYMTGISFLGENPKLIHTIYEDDFRTKKLKKDIFCLVTKAWGQGKCMRSYEESNFRPSRSDALPLSHKDLTLGRMSDVSWVIKNWFIFIISAFEVAREGGEGL